MSERESQEVSEYERQYEDGSDPHVLDIVDVPVLSSVPYRHQSENWLLDPERYWEKVGRVSWFDLPDLQDTEGPLWVNGHETYHGLNDRVPIELTDGLDDSLKLIHVDELRLSVFKPGEAFGNAKRRVQGSFTQDGVPYALWVTDPVYERRYLAKLDGDYRIGECFLTVSLGEQYQGACYKLIAAVIPEQRG